MNDSAYIELDLQHGWADFGLRVEARLPVSGVTAIFGHSGSGKTTLLRCIAGLERARGGRVTVAEECWQDDSRGLFVPPHKRALGYVFQEASLFPHLSVRRNLEYGQRRIAASERRISLDQAVELLGIGHLLERSPQRLSGGERQRVGIARALATSPRLLLLDEPLAALDQRRKQEVLPYLARLHAELGIPMLYVSHSLAEVTRLADHMLYLEAGEVRAVGPLNRVLTSAELPLAHLDEAETALEGRIEAHDQAFQLSYVRVPGGRLALPLTELPAGRAVRVGIQARDVSLALEKPQRSSILNQLQGQVLDVLHEPDSAQSLVRIDLGGAVLLSRITRRSAVELELRGGIQVYAQIKAVALVN
ncbi:molybdenum ABC transporter ATP-binding protein [Pseudomonas kuykendallii]|uniref:molybdenum ABC transporter ATP-binding protein n=1 Tax=Pseudomonas kuykendallii TaxID=1007099 RepID=UPI0028D17F91|nr:molybdenum ABC transporter ATP-binding protein [Pseudomonas kuykendallii]